MFWFVKQRKIWYNNRDEENENMTNFEIEKGEIIRQNGILNVLAELGFKENEDFIFLRNGNVEPYIFMDGEKPMYAIKIYSGHEAPLQLYSQERKQTYEIPVIDELDINKQGAVDSDKHFRYGITSGNNGIGAIYVPGQGMIISPSYEIKNIMERLFRFHETGFFVPLSNGETFRSKNRQQEWNHVKNNQQWQDLRNKSLDVNEAEQKRRDKIYKIEQVTWALQESVKLDKMPLWAQEQLKGNTMQ